MERKWCSSKGCREPHRARGYCLRHYNQMKRRGELDLKAPRQKTGPKALPLEQRFWAKVKKQRGGCWEWQAHRCSAGYGRIGRSRSEGVTTAHRVSWTLAYGDIPSDQFVLHKCDNRACVRPEHLFLGSQLDNMRDMHAKGRSWQTRSPEYAARGDANGSRRHPERLKRGSEQPRSKLTEEDVLAIRQRVAAGEVRRKMAAEFGVSAPLISAIVKRRIWTHI